MYENINEHEIIKYVQETVPNDNLVGNPTWEDFRIKIIVKNLSDSQITKYEKQISDFIIPEFAPNNFEVEIISNQLKPKLSIKKCPDCNRHFSVKYGTCPHCNKHK